MKALAISTMVLMLGVSVDAMAKSINLYDQPKPDAKVIYTADSNAGIITIYTPKEGGWVKVADPRNGNVGWVKTADLNGVGVHFNIMQTGDGSNGYQVIQLGGPTPTAEQISAMTKKMQERQQEIQKDVSKVMTDIYNNMNQYWKNMPMMMPVIIVPEKKAEEPAKGVPAAKVNGQK